MRCIWIGWLTLFPLVSLWAAALPGFDFTRPEVCAEWGTPHHIAALRPIPEGLEIPISGEDPYFYGPARDFPEGVPLWLLLKIKSDQGGDGQVFYFRDQAREENSVHFWAPVGQWTEVRLPLPALGPGYRLRLDPPGQGGRAVLASIGFASAASLTAPAWPKPVAVDFTRAVRLRSGPVELQVAGRNFRLLVEGQPVADSHSRPLIGYTIGDQLRWLDLEASRQARPRLEQAAGRIRVASLHKDADGGTWRITQRFAPNRVAGVVDVEVSVEVDRERGVGFLPVMLLVAGQGGPDTTKQQGLLAGLEYLDNEPSSSEADLLGPEAQRQVPANHKITFPLMAILGQGRYVGLIWEQGPDFSALFDSPDRLLGTGGHLLGVLYPGSDGINRQEGSLMPRTVGTLAAGRALVLKAQLIGGAGASLVPAVQQYVRVRGWPDIVPNGYALGDYVTLAAHGWLDSKIREKDRFRHAVWPGFGAQPAADAAFYMRWLARQTPDSRLQQRLFDAEQAALGAVPPGGLNQAGVSHVRYPVPSLIYGHVAESVAAAQTQARGLLTRFEADGSIPYRKSPNHEDYGRTHFAPDANGLTSQVVASLLEAAVFSGDRALIDQAVQRLHGLDKFRNTVPRGAQTWEVPLHTPDILASAHLVRAYTLGYELTGEKGLLDQAIYWAWTGVPFVYLVTPVGFPQDRPYGTIPVYGATGWRAPVWFGRPVQWCGLVYADALYRLIRHDPTGPWKRLADGITSVGIHYSWPQTDAARQGLLPDVWEMLAQQRAGPAINPGTVQANAIRLYGKGSYYDSRCFRTASQVITVHAPGELDVPAAPAGSVRFRVQAWPREPYYVLVNGLAKTPQVRIDGQTVPVGPPHEFHEKEGFLILKLSGQPTVELH